MLDQRKGVWETGPMEVPFGQGINFQIETNELDALEARLLKVHWPIYEERQMSYKTANVQTSSRWEILVQDPDGYLLRFAMSM